MSSNTDCDNGDKFVIKNTAGVNRRQFLFMDGRTILAFVPRGQKFYECSSFTEVTVQVGCKAVPGAVDIQLTSAAGGGNTTTPTPLPTTGMLVSYLCS